MHLVFPGGEMDDELIVYDILGRRIKTLVDKQLAPGEYMKLILIEVNFQAGLFCIIMVGNNLLTDKIYLTK